QNDRLQSLLELSRLPTHYLTANGLLQSVYQEVSKHIPLRCLALCDVTRQKFLAMYSEEDGDPQSVSSEGDSAHVGFDSLLAEAEPRLLVQNWVERNTGLDTTGLL